MSGSGPTPDDDWFDALGGETTSPNEKERRSALWVRAEYLRKSAHLQGAEAPEVEAILHREAELQKLFVKLEQKGYFANPPVDIKLMTRPASARFFQWPRAGWLLAASFATASIVVFLPNALQNADPMHELQIMRGHATRQTRLVGDPRAEAERLCAALRSISAGCNVVNEASGAMLSARVAKSNESDARLHALELVSDSGGNVEVHFESAPTPVPKR